MSTQSFFIFFLLMPIFIAQSCNVSQYIDPTTKNCTDCPQNCTKCYFDTNINSVYCAKCRENNGFNLLQKKCVLCPPGCTNCFYYGALTDQILIALNKDLRVLFGVESKCMVCPVINNVQLTFFQVMKNIVFIILEVNGLIKWKIFILKQVNYHLTNLILYFFYFIYFFVFVLHLI